MPDIIGISNIDKVIRSRRSVYPKMYNDEVITDDEIMHVLENANWAPTHKKTEPWRFKVLRDGALVRLGEFLAADYKKRTPEELFSEMKYNKMRTKPTQASCVIAIYMFRDPDERLPEWEEMAAVSAAVQNMWLTCTSMGIASYWSTPSSFIKAEDFIPVHPAEKCMGLFYMGKWDKQELPAQRGAIEEKITWINE